MLTPKALKEVDPITATDVRVLQTSHIVDVEKTMIGTKFGLMDDAWIGSGNEDIDILTSGEKPLVALELMTAKNGEVSYSLCKYKLESLEEGDKFAMLLNQHAAVYSVGAPV